jgi:hypothetical protein
MQRTGRVKNMLFFNYLGGIPHRGVKFWDGAVG